MEDRPMTSVDIRGMVQAQQDFQQALDQINTIYSSMDEERDTLAANWVGEAASAFGQALGNWIDDLYYIQQELIIMTETLSTHTGIYADATETSTQTADAFQQGLSGLEGLPVPGEAQPRELLAAQPAHMTARLAARRMDAAIPATPAVDAAALRPELMRTFPETPAIPAEPVVPATPREFFPLIPETPAMPASPTNS
jgi:WXG100 family type VII secretion target